MKQQLSLLFVMMCTSLFAQNITLQLNSNLKNQMNVTESPSGTYNIQTMGGDPWIQTTPVPTYNPEQVYVISFDYLTENGLDDLQVFYGAPVSAARLAKFGSLSPTSE